MAKKAMSFENAMLRLDEIVKLLESGNTSLEDSLKLFEEGTGLAAGCSAMLDQAELKITKLTAAAEEAPVEEVIADESQLSE